jgi:glycosyltransferase involved in cell wall biosynthesis
MKNIGFISTRISGTDGVSHEIEKWSDVFTGHGYSCCYCAGEIDRDPGCSFLIEEAHFKHPEIVRINQGVFGKKLRTHEITGRILSSAGRIRQKLDEFIRNFGIDCIVAENALSIPMNIPLGIALTELIAETGIPVIAHHHDFAWERERFLVNAAGDYIQMSFPPVLPSMAHVVINSLAQASLAHRKGVSSTLIPNTFDYGNPPTEADPGALKRLRQEAGISEGEYFILQPTRVVPRKCIELSIDLVSRLEGAGRKLVLSHPSGDEGEDYHRMLSDYAENKKVELRHIDNLVAPGRRASQGKPYTIDEVYQAADLVTYPSKYEGFGNAFLEAVYFRKPLVVNRYPVFVADIEIYGFELCRIDGLVTSETVREVRTLLSDEGSRKRMADKNYSIAGEHFSHELLEKLLMSVIERF